MSGPESIVCLTEETTEWLYLLGEERRIVGISGYTVRPRRAREEKPKISSFLDGRIEKIVALEPDLVIGFSGNAGLASAPRVWPPKGNTLDYQPPSAAFGLLIGASAQSIYNWEEGKARPRAQHLPAIFAL